MPRCFGRAALSIGSRVAHGNVQVADFGTAAIASIASGHRVDINRPAGRELAARTKCVGTPLWMAPEVLGGQRYGPSADVYSFGKAERDATDGHAGIVMWEIAAQALPWAADLTGEDDNFLDELALAVLRGTRPSVGAAWPRFYCSVMQACWAAVPDTRPSFDAVIPRLVEGESLSVTAL